MNKQTIQILSIAFFALLLFWGGYTLLYYLGIPVHGGVLLDDATKTLLQESCQPDGFLCRGWQAFVPFLLHTFGRAQPFLGYAIASLLLYVGYLGWKGLTTGRFEVRTTLTPWKVLLLFLLCLWMIFTTISFIRDGDASIRRVVEPLPNVYVGVGPEGLEELQKNFNELQERGCLTSVGNFANGAGVFEMKMWCVQGSFITRVLPQVAMVLVFLFELLVLGSLLFSLFRLPQQRPLVEALLSVGLGACGWIVLLWFLAVIGFLIPTAGWVLLFVVPAVAFRQTISWVRRFLTTTWTVEGVWYAASFLIGWLLFSYLAFNFLNVIRPFPIGWDDLGSYLNRPRLMVSYGHFIYSMASFQWEYLSSLGWLLFGYDNTFGATAAMVINWSEGLLAVLTVFTLTNVFLGRGHGFLAALLYYALPLVGHFSFADMKIDNAVFTMGALGTLAVFLYLFPAADEQDDGRPVAPLAWLAIAGIFIGFAFGMKVTSIMVLLALGTVLFGASLHPVGFFGAFFLAVALLTMKGALNLTRVGERLFGEGASIGTTGFLLLCVLLGVGLAGAAAWLRRDKLIRTLLACAVFGGSFVLAIAPWIAHNNYLIGNVMPAFELGAPNLITPVIDLGGTQEQKEGGAVVRSLPPELALDMQNPVCSPTGHLEELDRYWGFRHGWEHYLTLPWRSVMNLDSAGYYVTTTAALLLFPLLLLLPYIWTRRGRWMLWLFLGTIFILLQWMFLANGIPWYGVGVFLGLVIGLEVLVARAPDLQSRILSGSLVGLSLIGMFGMRFWQFEQQRNLFEYPIGKVTATALEERTIPHYDDIRETVTKRREQMPDRPYMYRVGTFIPYFIPKNLEIIAVTDHQLDTFNCIHQERDTALTLQRLKALGFNSIIFDTNTATIEKDPNGSLHQKVSTFVNFLNDASTGMQIVINDPQAGVALVLIP